LLSSALNNLPHLGGATKTLPLKLQDFLNVMKFIRLLRGVTLTDEVNLHLGRVFSEISLFISANEAFTDAEAIYLNRASMLSAISEDHGGELMALLQKSIFSNSATASDVKFKVLIHMLNYFIESNPDRYLPANILSEGSRSPPIPYFSHLTVAGLFEDVVTDDSMVVEILNSLYPKDLQSEQSYFPLHLDKSRTETPSQVYVRDDETRSEKAKEARKAYLNDLIRYVIVKGVVSLKKIEMLSIELVGLKTHCKNIAWHDYPERFGNLKSLWVDGEVERNSILLQQSYVRYFLRKHMDDLEWLNSNYAIVDNEFYGTDTEFNIWIGDLGMGAQSLSLTLSRYLQIERFSRFIKAHVLDLTGSLNSRKADMLHRMLGVDELIHGICDLWVNWDGQSATMRTIMDAFWDEYASKINEECGLNLPTDIENLFDGHVRADIYSEVLGKPNGETGLYGGMKRLLILFTGRAEVAGTPMVKAYDEQGTTASGAFQRNVWAGIQRAKATYAAQSTESLDLLNRRANSKDDPIHWVPMANHP